MMRRLAGFTLAIVAVTSIARADTADQLRTSWPENDLERLLVAGAMDKAKSPDFVRALLNGEICALAQKAPDASNPDEKIAVLAVKSPDGELAAPVFTSMHRAREVFDEKHIIVCGRADVLLNAMRGNTVIIDPGQPFGFIFTADELDHMLGVPFVITSAVQLQPPSDAPAAMIEKLKSVLSAEPHVTGAWLSLAYWPDKKEWSWYLDVQTTLDTDAVRTLIRNASSEIDMLGRPLDTAINAPIKNPDRGMMLLER